ncbi:GNAT family N-acetyltransferase [Desulfobacula sp.]|uniref:GNAT family N-acetyltransferase n=1 Tax=Desulfobacula sp. TaxID=2593537 RepID=UPI002714CCBF|nr:GNAT family N-acetyltransferase [Desulfobacula sp.]
MISTKQKYRVHCKVEPSIPIFSKDWWLDAVCGKDNWDVVVVEKGGQIIASMPYYMVKRRGRHIVTMPKLTQTMGPWLKYPPNQKYANRLSFEKNVMDAIINGLPKFDSFSQNFHYSIVNWLPFYWKGFKQTTRYTYVIDDLSNLEEVEGEFSHAKRKNIKKAEKIINVQFDLSAKDFYENHKLTLAKQGEKIVYTCDHFKNIYTAGYNNKAARTIYAMDAEGNIHAALFVIWDSQSAYDLISTIDPDFRSSGAASLLVKEIIKYVSNFTKKFDFEGSMIENVENSFRQFGTVQKPYFQLTKVNSPFVKIYQDIRSCGGMLRQFVRNKS